jgi:hypothetical protein
MDVLAHGLWTNAMYKVIPQTRGDARMARWGIVFGLLPDFVAFAPIFAWMTWQLVTGDLSFSGGRPDFDAIPLGEFTAGVYNFTHSLVIFAIGLGLAWAIARKFPWFMLGWALHIGIDIFTHTTEFYATPFLYPLSGLKVNGIEWSHPWFMAINYGLLLLFYFYLLPRYFRKPQQPEMKNPAT